MTNLLRSEASQAQRADRERYLSNLSNNGHLPSATIQAAAPPVQPSQWVQGLHMEALANLAHELRSPVQAILGYLDILRDELRIEPGGRHRQMIERWNANAHDLAQTVENVMDFSVADAMAESAAEEEIRPHDLIEDLAPALEAANDSKSLQIRFDLEDAPAVFRARRRPIKAILLNLGVNAIRFTNRGGVTIAIRRSKSPDFEPAIELEVSDTGPGIEAEQVAQAFKPFTQLSRSSIRSHRGMGLGLAVVQRNVVALGAKITVATAPGQGSTFVVTIPICA